MLRRWRDAIARRRRDDSGGKHVHVERVGTKKKLTAGVKFKPPTTAENYGRRTDHVDAARVHDENTWMGEILAAMAKLESLSSKQRKMAGGWRHDWLLNIEH